MSLNWHSFRYAALWSWHQLLTLALACLVIVAIVVGLGRQLTPTVREYHAVIESRLSKAVGVPVRIDGISGSWQGMTPFFLIEGLQLRSPVRPAETLLRVPRVELRPSLWQSLLAFEPRVDVRVQGLDIHLEQVPDGSVRLRELSSLSRTDPAAARRALEAALRQPLLALENSRVELALTGYPVLRLRRIQLSNRNEGELHRIAGEVFLEDVQRPVALNMELRGDPVAWQKGALAIWLRLPTLPLDAWLPETRVAGIGLEEARGGGEFWLRFRSGRLVGVQSRPYLERAVFNSSQGLHVLQGVQGELGWERQGKGWQMSAQRLTARLDNVAWPVPTLALREQEGRLSVAAAGVKLDDALLLANRLSLPGVVAGWLREATPDGRMSAMRVDLTQTTGGWTPQQAQVRFEGLGIHATERFPGVRNLSGWVHWTPDSALLGLDVVRGRLDLRQVFREPVAVDRLQGVLRLRHLQEQWQIESDRLVVRNADATGQAVMRLDVPHSGEASPHLALLARLTGGQVGSAWRYVPWSPAGDATLAWLRRALVAGTVTKGDFLMDGPLHHEPGQLPMRQLMRFDLHGAVLDYQPGWPAVKAMDGVVTIDGGHLRVEARQARLLDGTVAQGIVADIPDLRQARLTVAGDLQSTGPDLLRLFRESPLRSHTAGVANHLALDGPIKGRLTLDVPLSRHLPVSTSVLVDAELAGNRLRLPRQGLQADGLSGHIRYSTAAGLVAERLQANMLGAPVTARLASEVNRGVLQRVDVGIDGRVTAAALQGWLGGPLWSAMSGEAAYQAQLKIPAGAQSPQLLVTSALEGMRILLPSPLGKGPERTMLRYQSSLGQTEQLARLQLGRVLSAGLVWREAGLHGALLRLNASDAGWPSGKGIEIEGRLSRLALAEWQPWLDRFQAEAPGAAPATMPGVVRLEIDTKELEAYGWRLRDARLAVARESSAWRMRLANDELSGSLLLPDASRQEVTLDIDRLQWPLSGAPAVDKVKSPAAVLPASRPLGVRVQGLRLKEYPALGEVAVQTRLSPSPFGMRMDDLSLQSAVVRFDGRLDWQWRGGDSTRLRGVATCGDVAGLLKALRYAPTLQSRAARAEVDLSWPSAPQTLALQGLDGTLSVKVEKGRLLNVDAATSASRVFGLVDIENIRRRLKGDFSDVLTRGLSFDAVTLSGNVQAGVMPKAVFDLKGPSLSAHGEGRLDLARQQVDQAFTVNVPVSSAVPLAAAVVGGPLVGGAVAAAELVLKKQIQKVTVMHYRISGPWSNPVVERTTQRANNAVRQEQAKP